MLTFGAARYDDSICKRYFDESRENIFRKLWNVRSKLGILLRESSTIILSASPLTTRNCNDSNHSSEAIIHERIVF